MSVFEGKNTFNGKTVWVAEDIGWGEPSRWHLKFDDGTSLFVGLVAMTFKDQLDSLKYLLSRDAAGDSVGEKYIRELFDSNWKVSGQEDDAVG